MRCAFVVCFTMFAMAAGSLAVAGEPPVARGKFIPTFANFSGSCNLKKSATLEYCQMLDSMKGGGMILVKTLPHGLSD